MTRRALAVACAALVDDVALQEPRLVMKGGVVVVDHR